MSVSCIIEKQKININSIFGNHPFCSYIYNEEVKPAPGVGEVGLESIGDPLENHLHHEHVGEHLIRILQDRLYDPTLLHVDIFKSLFSNQL